MNTFNTEVHCYTEKGNGVPIFNLTEDEFAKHFTTLTSFEKAWLETNYFTSKKNHLCLLPNTDGSLKSVYFGLGEKGSLWDYASIFQKLPYNQYYFKNRTILGTLAWGLAAYDLSANREISQLLIDQELNYLIDQVDAIYWIRDLINMPANILSPMKLAEEASLLKEYGANIKVITGADLHKRFPSVYIMGQASSRAPCMIDISWGDKNNPKIVLIGKGVCFDSGGLSLKPPLAMVNMKKDMAGAAHVLGLAKLIMKDKLPFNLRILIPAIDNVVSGSAIKPGDIITTSSGKTVEVTNTDAEGRLILAEALTEASLTSPDFIIDFATLTGAARVALGTDLPALFSNDPSIMHTLMKIGQEISDPLWGLPLYKPYKSSLSSKVADLKNASNKPSGGAITAALFLDEFISGNPWIHLDIYAWNARSRAGRPEGGEVMGLRTIYHFIKQQISH